MPSGSYKKARKNVKDARNKAAAELLDDASQENFDRYKSISRVDEHIEKRLRERQREKNIQKRLDHIRERQSTDSNN